MSKNIIFPVSLCASAIALGIAGYTYYTMAHQPTTLPAIVDEQKPVVTDLPSEDVLSSATATFDIADSTLYVASGSLALKHSDDYISVALPETATDVEYYEDQGYLSWAEDGGRITISAISASDIESNYAHEFESDDDKLIIGVKQVTDDTGINIVANVSDKSKVESIQQIANAVCESVSACSGLDVSLCGLAVDSDCSVSFAKNVLCLVHNDNRLTASAYAGSIDGAGFDDKVNIDGKDFLYGDYKDSETNYTPYMYYTDNGLLKVMATSQDVLNSVFS